MEATHIIKPEGAVYGPVFDKLMAEYDMGFIKISAFCIGPVGDNEDQAIEKWNAIFTKAPKVYGYE